MNMINIRIGNPRVMLERCDVDKQSNVLLKKEANPVSRINSSWNYSVTASKVKRKNETLFKSRVSINLNSHITSGAANAMLKSTFLCCKNARKRRIAPGLNVPDFPSMKACCVSLTDVLGTKSGIGKKRKLNVSASLSDQSKLRHIVSTNALRTEGGKEQCESAAYKNQIDSVKKELKILLKRCDDVKSSNESTQPTSIVNKKTVSNLNDSNQLYIGMERRIKELSKVELTYFTERNPKIILKRCDDKVGKSFGGNMAQRKPLVEKNHTCMALAGANSFNIANNGLSIKTQRDFIIKTKKKVKTTYEISYSKSSMNFMKTSPRVILEKCDSEGWNANMRASEDSYETFNDETLSHAYCLFYPEVIVETATEIDLEWEINEKDQVDSVYKGYSLQMNEGDTKEAMNQNTRCENSWFSPRSSAKVAPLEANVSGCRYKEKSCSPSNLNTDSEEKPFPCGLCPSRFGRKSSMRKHQMSAHCEKKLSPSELVKELESSNDEFTQLVEAPSLSCKHCSGNFKQKAELRDHLMTHSAGRPFPCELCPARFSSTYLLKRHLVIHSSEKPYACEYCPAKFKRMNSLKGHQLLHSDDRPFECPHCPARFKLRNYLKQHQITHTEANFSCHHCSTRFRRQVTLHKHLRRSCKQIQETQIFTNEQLLLLQTVLLDSENSPRI